MRKETFQDIIWLFQELGQHLRPKVQDAPEKCDTRTLLRILVKDRPSVGVGERDPFNWFKELQASSNFWYHLSPESNVPEDEVWRDLDTMERVAKYLSLAPDFIEHIRGIKEKVWAEKNLEHNSSFEIKLRSWINEEVNRQLKHADSDLSSMVAESSESLAFRGNTGISDGYHGEIADRVRSFVVATYIEPARAKGQMKVSVRAGDVDKALGYQYRRLPLICNALRGKKFLEAARAKLTAESGPPSGASTTTTFTYEIEPSADE